MEITERYIHWLHANMPYLRSRRFITKAKVGGERSGADQLVQLSRLICQTCVRPFEYVREFGFRGRSPGRRLNKQFLLPLLLLLLWLVLFFILLHVSHEFQKTQNNKSQNLLAAFHFHKIQLDCQLRLCK